MGVGKVRIGSSSRLALALTIFALLAVLTTPTGAADTPRLKLKLLPGLANGLAGLSAAADDEKLWLRLGPPPPPLSWEGLRTNGLTFSGETESELFSLVGE